MKSRRFSRVSGLWMAVIAAVLAIAIAAGALARALTVHDPAAAPAPAIALPQIALSSGGDGSSLILDDDPFSPGRTAPAKPYTLAAALAPRKTGSQDGRAPEVLGTVVASDGSSFAISSLDGGSPKTVPVGGKIGDYVVETVGRGHVVFKDPSGRQVAVRAANGDVNRMPPLPPGTEGGAPNGDGTGWTGPDGAVRAPGSNGGAWTPGANGAVRSPGSNGAGSTSDIIVDYEQSEGLQDQIVRPRDGSRSATDTTDQD